MSIGSRCLSRIALAGIALLSTVPLSAQTPVVEEALIIKGLTWRQLVAASPTLEPRNPGVGYGGPASFRVSIRGTDLSGIPAPSITLPPGSMYPTQNPGRHNGGVLTYLSTPDEWRYGSDGNQWGGTSWMERDFVSFAYGTYGLTVLGETFNLNFPGIPAGTYGPRFVLSGGSWIGGKYVVPVDQALTVSVDPFSNYNANADAFMELGVNGVFEESVLRSDAPGSPNFLTHVIPANTLTPGQDYRGYAGFYQVMDQRGSFSTRLDATLYEDFTNVTIAAVNPPQTGALGTFYGVGELDGGTAFSEVRDATKSGGVIYAVGDGISNTGSSGADTAFVWSSTEGLRPLPDIVPNFTTAASIQAPAITPDATFIASRARAAAGGSQRHAVRVTRSDLGNLDLGTLPGFTFSQTSTISNDGSVLYGIAQYTSAPSVPVKNRAVRFAGGSVTPLPFLNSGDDNSTPADRAASADGNVVVGRSTHGPTDASDGVTGIGPGNRAFRYVHSTGSITAVPLLPDGTWNGAVAVSPDGNLVLVRGDSPTAPQGEFALYNVSTGSLASLGTPNGSRRPGGIVGMTSDGSVIATPFIPADNPTASTYIRNAHGWHDFEAIVAAAGIDTTGWRLNENLFGMSPDGTLVWGRGMHNGVREGFVIEFAPGFLASYQEPATFGTPGAAIVGAWSVGDTSTVDSAVLIFGADGYYTHIQRKGDATSADGFERGRYTWDAATGAFTVTTLLDLGGDHGLGASNDIAGITFTIAGDSATMLHPGEDPVVLSRVTSTTNPLIGAFTLFTSATDNAHVVFLPNGYYFLASDTDQIQDPADADGIEWGTYSWDPVSGIVTFNTLVNTDNDGGFSEVVAPEVMRFTFSGDLQTLRGIGQSGFFDVTRVGTAAIPGSVPVITAQPNTETFTAGFVASLYFTASGADLTYQWYRAGLPIPGATGNILPFHPVSRADADTYFVRVHSGLRYVDSVPARLSVAPSSYAQALQLDPTFAPAIDASGSQAFTNKIVLGPGGKFIVAGFFHTVAGQPRNRIVQFNSDGTLDATFAPTAIGPAALATAAYQADGKILIGGPDAVVLGHPRRLVRLNSDGSVDTAFNTGSGFAGGNVSSLAVQPDGRILVAGGFTTFNGAPCNRVVRLHADGTLDATFNATPDNLVNVITLQPDGRVLLGGQFVNINGSPRNRLARLNSDGTLDPAFVIGTGANATVVAIEVATDGSNAVLVGGSFNTYNGNTAVRLARLSSTGAFDAAFAVGTGFNNQVNAIACHSDGRVTVGGVFTSYKGVSQNRLVRLDATGTVDATFAIGSGANATVNTLALQSDGRMLVGGGLSAFNGASRNCTFLRVTAGGGIDVALNPTVFGHAGPNTITRQPDGKFLVGGNFTRVGGATRFNLARFHADGSLDAAFNPGTTSGTSIAGAVLAAYPRIDGKIVILGGFTAVGGSPANRIARLNSDGSLDPAFHSGSGLSNTHSLLVPQPDGRLLIGGNGMSNVSYDGQLRSGLVRILPDGQLDELFNAGTLFNGSVEAAVVQPDGRIVVAGNFTTVNGVAHSNIARLFPDGSLDPSFTTLAFNSNVTSLALQPDGRIVASGGFTTYGGAPKNRVIRFLSNGSMDPTFDVGLGTNQPVNGLQLQEDGRILVRGSFTTWNGLPTGSTVVRLRSDGSLDPTFALFGPVASPSVVPGLLVHDDGSMFALGVGFYDSTSLCPGVAHFARATALQIVSSPAPQAVAKDQPAAFSVLASGLPTITYQWRRNGVSVPGATGSSLSIASAQVSDRGDYDVLVTNPVGSIASNPATLTVFVPPMFSSQPTDQNVNVGDPVFLLTAVANETPPTYQWRKDGVNIPGAIDFIYIIPSATTAHAGNYTLVATNAGGSVVSNVAEVRVTESFVDWGASAGLVGPAAALTADPDGDGITNLMEYALGLSPTNTGSGPGAAPTMVKLPDTDVEFSFTRPTSVVGVTYSIETRASLATGSWTPVPFTLVNLGGGKEQMKIELPTGAPAGYVRLVVTKTP